MVEKRRRASPPEDDESAWIEALQAGDPHAFRKLIERYQGSVYQVCLKMMNHNATEAEDMAQETLIRVSEAIGQFRRESKLSTWVYRIAINLCKNRISYLSRRADYKHDHLPRLEESAGDSWERRARPYEVIAPPDQIAEGHEAQEIINQALEKLSPGLREVITLRDFEGLSYAEIVEIVQVPLGTVKSRLHQARLQLMDYYQQQQKAKKL